LRLRLVSLAAALLCGTGCYTVDVYAPRGQEVVLLPASAPTDTHRQWRTWFAVFGLVGMDNTMPQEIIHRETLSQVRVVVIDTVPDALIGLFYNVIFPIGLGVQSMKVDGAAPHPVPGPSRNP